MKQKGNGVYKNWVEEDRVSSVKNQGSCGGCWAFSAVSIMESIDAIKNNRSAISLSN